MPQAEGGSTPPVENPYECRGHECSQCHTIHRYHGRDHGAPPADVNWFCNNVHHMMFPLVPEPCEQRTVNRCFRCATENWSGRWYETNMDGNDLNSMPRARLVPSPLQQLGDSARAQAIPNEHRWFEVGFTPRQRNQAVAQERRSQALGEEYCQCEACI